MNYPKLKSVCLVFENCDSAVIEAKDIHSFNYEITRTVVDYQQWNDYVYHQKYSSYFRLILRNLEDIKYASGFDGKSESLYKRIIHPDITSIEINFEDDTKEHFYIPFKTRDGWGLTSIYQNVKKLGLWKHYTDLGNDVYTEYRLWELDISKEHLLRKYIKWYLYRMKHPIYWTKSIWRTFYYGYHYSMLRVRISNFFYDLKERRDKQGRIN